MVIEIGVILSTITTTLAKMESVVAKVFTFLMEKGPVIIDKVGKFIDIVYEIFALRDEMVDNTDLGINVEKYSDNKDFFSAEDYINETKRNDVSAEKENMSLEELQQYKALGIAMKALNLTEKTGLDISPEFLVGMSRLNLTANIIKGAINLVKEENYQPNIEGFLEGKVNAKEDIKVHDFLEKVINESGENKTLTEVLKGAE